MKHLIIAIITIAVITFTGCTKQSDAKKTGEKTKTAAKTEAKTGEKKTEAKTEEKEAVK